MNRLFELQNALSCVLNETSDGNEKKEAIFQHLGKAKLSKLDMTALLRSDQEWLNTERPLSWKKDLEGRILVLDFFTYCCVNCLHLLPKLKRLEATYPPEKGLAVLGVHSAKFLNEKSSANVASAILQNDISHCVLNDPRMELWNEFQISCWPTLLIIGPKGEPLFVLMGEGSQEELFLYCESALDYFQAELRLSPLPVRLLRDEISSDFLRFPGKVTSGLRNNEIAVADTGNNRIVILTSEGVVKERIGGPEAGFEDGSLQSCRFNRPQGLVFWSQDIIYVADTENHAIRLIDLNREHVTTVAGTGQQGLDYEGGKVGTEQAISTPWDLCFAPPFGSSVSAPGESVDRNVLYIAMAGLHQIWALCVKDCPWPKFSEPMKKGQCFAVAGSGKEENRNNAYPKRSGFAQPSGLTFSPELNCLFVADSESSSVRSISLTDGSVKAVVGGNRDPTNLFAFGDQDGIGFEAKLQHPLGVAWSRRQQLLYVLDSYNHKLKIVEPTIKKCQQMVLDYPLHEPGGICIFRDEEHLLVADTQAHALLKVFINRTPITTYQVPIVMVAESKETCVDGLVPEDDQSVSRCVQVRPGGILTVSLLISIHKDLKFSQEAPQSWILDLPEGLSVECSGPRKGRLDVSGGRTDIVLKLPEEPDSTSPMVRLQARTYICEETQNVCLSRERVWTLRIEVVQNLTSENCIELDWHIKK